MSENNEIKIIYSDRSLLVCIKPAGIPCETANEKTKSLSDILSEQLSSNGKTPYIGMVHRLDQVTEGLMVYSLSEKATGKLSEYMSSGEAHKEYLAVVHGTPDAPEGEMRDLLFRDPRKNKSFVVDRSRRGVKEAKLEYKLLCTTDTPYGTLSSVRIKLHTGRTHQIRVQFASRGMPLFGDGKYGAKDNAPRVALLSHRLVFPHPQNGKTMEFSIDKPNDFPWNIFE